MPKTLIAYSTVDGQTLKICGHIRQQLEAAGHAVTMFDLGSGQACELAPFDTVVLGASIRYGKHRPELYRFVEVHRAELARKRSAFFTVNVVARKPGKDSPETNPYLQTFLRLAAWRPTELGVFAGRIDYPRYRFVDRQMIRLIMWMTHGPTDPRSCTEFTDWAAVDRFAYRVGQLGLN